MQRNLTFYGVMNMQGRFMGIDRNTEMMVEITDVRDILLRPNLRELLPIIDQHSHLLTTVRPCKITIHAEPC